MRFKKGVECQAAVVSVTAALISDGDSTPSAASDRRRSRDSFSIELIEKFLLD
jgi:hypothetical protein